MQSLLTFSTWQNLFMLYEIPCLDPLRYIHQIPRQTQHRHLFIFSFLQFCKLSFGTTAKLLYHPAEIWLAEKSTLNLFVWHELEVHREIHVHLGDFSGAKCKFSRAPCFRQELHSWWNLNLNIFPSGLKFWKRLWRHKFNFFFFLLFNQNLFSALDLFFLDNFWTSNLLLLILWMIVMADFHRSRQAGNRIGLILNIVNRLKHLMKLFYVIVTFQLVKIFLSTLSEFI